MKLKNISCTQFAGIDGRNITLEDGINVICGPNESGKTTLVSLLLGTLFQKAKIDGRSVEGKEFSQRFFPSERKGSDIRGDFIDGKVTFETEDGVYTLEKEWGDDSRVRLRTPNGILTGATNIDAVLEKALIYGKGVYSDLLFLTQNHLDESLKTLLNASVKSDAKREIVNAASQAFAESDGIAMDAVRDAIKTNIDTLAGSHWNEERHAPEPKAGRGRWLKGLGEILTAYYRAEDARTVLSEIDQLSGAMDAASRTCSEKTKQVEEAEHRSEDFRRYATLLKEEQENRKKANELKQKQARYSEALERWPRAEAESRQAQSLGQELENRTLLDKFALARKAHDELDKVDHALAERPCPTPEEIRAVQKAEGDITRLESRLLGMNLNAAVRMLGDHSVEITTVRTGDPVALDDGKAAITEAVKITVPGVMEMELTPADVDAAAIAAEVAAIRKKRSAVLSRYKTETPEDLMTLQSRILAEKTRENNGRARLETALQGTDFDKLRKQAEAIPKGVRPAPSIQCDIRTLCGRKEVSYFLGTVGNELDTFRREYTDQETLRGLLQEVGDRLEALKKRQIPTEEIPAAYRRITDPERYQKSLIAAVKQAQEDKENALKAKSAAETELKTYKEAHEDDPEEQLARAERLLNEAQEELRHWRHIEQIFQEQRAKIHNNPTEDIATNFARYLSIISDGRVTSEFPLEDRLQMDLYSNDFRLDYPKLSEGTKETVALAFRLAVLDHLFPDGGGLAVLDDPFTDMDTKRMQQSCALLKECAQRHQVIVLTCRDEYLPLLGGNVIRV